MKNWNAKLLLAGLALQLPPCVVAAEAPRTDLLEMAGPESAPLPMATPTDEAPAAVGTLTLQWTISGRRDASDCAGLGVERLQLSVKSAAAADEDQSEGSCDAFQLSVDLAPGSYAGDAFFVDRFDRPVTLSVPLEQVEVMAGREVIKSIDFPVAAFLSFLE